jgi:hypothetical protein
MFHFYPASLVLSYCGRTWKARQACKPIWENYRTNHHLSPSVISIRMSSAVLIEFSKIPSFYWFLFILYFLPRLPAPKRVTPAPAPATVSLTSHTITVPSLCSVRYVQSYRHFTFFVNGRSYIAVGIRSLEEEKRMKDSFVIRRCPYLSILYVFFIRRQEVPVSSADVLVSIHTSSGKN